MFVYLEIHVLRDCLLKWKEHVKDTKTKRYKEHRFDTRHEFAIPLYWEHRTEKHFQMIEVYFLVARTLQCCYAIFYSRMITIS